LEADSKKRDRLSILSPGLLQLLDEHHPWLQVRQISRMLELSCKGPELALFRFWRSYEPESLAYLLYIGHFPVEDRIRAFASMISHHTHYAM
jgi:hypothetical protein